MTVNQALKILEASNVFGLLKWRLIEIKVLCGGSFKIDIALEEEILKYAKY